MDNFEKSNKWIFLVPIDGITNKNNPKNKTELSNYKNIEKNNNHKEENNNDINFIENNKNIKKNEKQEDLKAYSYSFISKTKNIPRADSSKIYMSEFLKKNWKLRTKRLVLKLKKRYTKQSQRAFLKNTENTINEFSEIHNNINSNNFGENYETNISNTNSINFENNNYKNNYFQLNHDTNNCNFNINNLNISNNKKNYYNYYIFNNNNSNINK